MTMVTEDLGTGIRKLRRDLGWSQVRLAAELGVNHSTVWRWEHGRADPHPSHYEQLAALAPFADIVADLEET